MKSIRALTFDLDNTLWETDLSILKAEDAMAAHLRRLSPPAWMVDLISTRFVQSGNKLLRNNRLSRIT